jgi:HSP20 family protein
VGKLSTDDKSKNNESQRPNFDLKRIFDSFIEETIDGFDNLVDENSFSVELQETSSDVIIEARLPGYSKDQIGIEVEANQIHITVTDEKVIEEQDDNRNYYRKEKSYSQLGRTVTLSFPVSKKNTTAEFQNGILTIVTPK